MRSRDAEHGPSTVLSMSRSGVTSTDKLPVSGLAGLVYAGEVQVHESHTAFAFSGELSFRSIADSSISLGLAGSESYLPGLAQTGTTVPSYCLAEIWH